MEWRRVVGGDQASGEEASDGLRFGGRRVRFGQAKGAASMEIDTAPVIAFVAAHITALAA